MQFIRISGTDKTDNLTREIIAASEASDIIFLADGTQFENIYHSRCLLNPQCIGQ